MSIGVRDRVSILSFDFIILSARGGFPKMMFAGCARGGAMAVWHWFAALAALLPIPSCNPDPTTTIKPAFTPPAHTIHTPPDTRHDTICRSAHATAARREVFRVVASPTLSCPTVAQVRLLSLTQHPEVCELGTSTPLLRTLFG